MERLSEDRAIAVDELEEEIASYVAEGQRVYVPGDGAYLLSEQTAALVAIPDHPLIIGNSVALAAQNISSVSAGELGLRYLRLSQAEREKKEKEKTK